MTCAACIVFSACTSEAVVTGVLAQAIAGAVDNAISDVIVAVQYGHIGSEAESSK